MNPIRKTIDIALVTICIVAFCFIVAKQSGFMARSSTPFAFARPFTEKILFVGNSFTFVGHSDFDDLPGVPGLFLSLARARGHNPMVVAKTLGSSNFYMHYTNQSGAMDAIHTQEWNYVVLQAQSQEAAAYCKGFRFFDYGTALSKEIKAYSPKGKVLFYETWAFAPGHEVYKKSYKDPAAMQAEIRANYVKMAHLNNDTVVRVGDAFEKAEKTYPKVPVISSDKMHQSDAGAYLSALMFYKAVYHDNVKGLPAAGNVSDSEAKALQNVAAAVP